MTLWCSFSFKCRGGG